MPRQWFGGSQVGRLANCCKALQPMSTLEKGEGKPAAKPQPICALARRTTAAEVSARAGVASARHEGSFAENAASGLQPICRAGDAQRASVEDVGVDHRRLEVAVAEELLDGANVRAVLEQVGGVAVTLMPISA